MSKFDSNDIFNKWRRQVNGDNPTEKYLYKEREDHIIALVDLFQAGGVDYEDAKMYRNRVLETLTTREGRKGVGRYKGWKENVLSDFDKIFADYYINLDVEKKEEEKVVVVEKEEEEVDVCIIENTDLINDWVDRKYLGNEYIRQQAHNPRTYIFIEFIKDVFKDSVV